MVSLFNEANRGRINDRAVDELLGLCRGVLADGEVNQAEAEFLLGWIEGHRDVADQWPANVLYERLIRMLKDGVLDLDEQQELLGVLIELTGVMLSDSTGKTVVPGVKPMPISTSTKLPLSIPAPDIIFQGNTFCLTGIFATGTRKECESLVSERGGLLAKNPTLKTDYVVIGIVGNNDWIHSSYGRKIERAVEISHQNGHLAIVSEEHWQTFL